ncbi:MAG: hypothetical protein ACI8W8_002166 [Rhodothermales bacterium]|jgi:hypothetical protein
MADLPPTIPCGVHSRAPATLRCCQAGELNAAFLRLPSRMTFEKIARAELEGLSLWASNAIATNELASF